MIFTKKKSAYLRKIFFSRIFFFAKISFSPNQQKMIFPSPPRAGRARPARPATLCAQSKRPGHPAQTGPEKQTSHRGTAPPRRPAGNTGVVGKRERPLGAGTTIIAALLSPCRGRSPGTSQEPPPPARVSIRLTVRAARNGATPPWRQSVQGCRRVHP